MADDDLRIIAGIFNAGDGIVIDSKGGQITRSRGIKFLPGDIVVAVCLNGSKSRLLQILEKSEGSRLCFFIDTGDCGSQINLGCIFTGKKHSSYGFYGLKEGVAGLTWADFNLAMTDAKEHY